MYMKILARPEGLEPPTPRFEAWYSIQLSYGRLGGPRNLRCRSAGLEFTHDGDVSHGTGRV